MGIEVLPKRLQAVEGSYEQLSDMGVRKELLEPFDDLIRTCEDILHDEAMRKKKHETGIQEARRKGIRIGRPPVPISMDFLKLEGLYSKTGYRCLYLPPNEKEIREGDKGMEVSKGCKVSGPPSSSWT